MANELIGIFHLSDAPLTHFVMKPFITPVLAHLGMNKVLVDCRQICGQDLIEDVDDSLFRFHDFPPFSIWIGHLKYFELRNFHLQMSSSEFIINRSARFVNLIGPASLSLKFIIGDNGSQSRRKRNAGFGECGLRSFELIGRE
jgi:hypothetical protein